MSTDTVSSTKSVVRTLEDLNNSNTAKASALGKDAFLQLLVAQMSNQDPLQPSSDTEYIAQLAQFSMLEQIQNLNTSSTTNQAYNLIGKYVYVTKEEDATNPKAEQIFGKVDGVFRQDGIDYLVVGSEQYKLSEVTGVIDVASSDTMDEKILQSANLIGKTVTAKITNTDNTTTTVTGQVSKITIKDGVLYATVSGQDIELSDIQEIVS